MRMKFKYPILFLVLSLLLVCSSVSALAVWDGSGESGGGSGSAIQSTYTLSNANIDDIVGYRFSIYDGSGQKSNYSADLYFKDVSERNRSAEENKKSHIDYYRDYSSSKTATVSNIKKGSGLSFESTDTSLPTNPEEETTRIPSDTTIFVEETTGSPEETEPEPVVTKPVHTHAYSEKVVNPTCTTDGYTLHSCNCGHSYKDNTTYKLGHLYTTWYTVKEATTTSAGLEECKCDTCGGATISKEIPKKAVNSSIDPRVEVRNIYGTIEYSYGTCSVRDRRTWGNVFSVSVLDNGGLRVTYDNKDGEIIKFDISVSPEGYVNAGTILSDGTHVTQLIGSHS